MYNYNFYGLGLTSEIEMPELPTWATTTPPPTISIQWGAVSRPPDDIKGAHYKPDSVAHPDFYYLEVDDIAKYYIDGKETIHLERMGDASNRDVVAFLIDTVLTILLLKHDKYVFHASAIAGPQGAVMICGHSGVGKSSIALRLLDRGYQFIEDDRCLLYWNEEEKKVFLKNHLPFIDIWSNEIKKIEKMEGAKVMHSIRDNISKLRVDINDYVNPEGIPLDKVITLTTRNDSTSTAVQIITGLAKCRKGKSFTHLDHLISYVGNASTHFGYLMRTLSAAPMIHVSRSNRAKPGDIADFLNNEILSREVQQIIETVEA